MNTSPPDPGVQPRRILVRGVNWLGDAVMTTPALLRLREKFSAAHIAILTPDKLRDLFSGHPAISETLAFSPGDNFVEINRKLRAKNFDTAIVFPNSMRSALECWAAGIPRRIGYARQWRKVLLTQAIAPRAEAVKMRKPSLFEIKAAINAPPGGPARVAYQASGHHIHEYLRLAAALGASQEPVAPLLAVTIDEIAAAKRKFGLEEITAPIFGLNSGAEYGPAKRWPAARFIAAAQAIQKQTNCVWLFLGGKGDQAIATQIQSAIGNRQSSVNLAGQTTLRELMALLKLCRLLLTNDTGPMHVAAALGVSVVAPFGSTSPELTGPGLPGGAGLHILKSDAPCSPCFLRECPIDFRCMNGIAVERVVEAVLKTAAS